MTTDFYGPYVNINDQCGTSSLTGSIYLDWGTSGGIDCTTPGWGGAGNTHASRTGFYELNKMIEMARGQLPSNSARVFTASSFHASVWDSDNVPVEQCTRSPVGAQHRMEFVTVPRAAVSR